MVKVFSSGKIVYLVSNYDRFEPNPASLYITVASRKELTDFYQDVMTCKEVNEIWFCYENVELLLEWFSSMYKVVAAAGGLVKNENGAFLFIFRNGKWDLPKGKIEKGETIEVAAVREVEEECGIGKLRIVKQLNPTYHTYLLKEQQVLKPTYWFEMTSSDTTALVPQTEEGITEVRWIAIKDLGVVRDNTYESILDVIAHLR